MTRFGKAAGRLALVCVLEMVGCQLSALRAGEQESSRLAKESQSSSRTKSTTSTTNSTTQESQLTTPAENELVIENAELPDGYPGAPYELLFHARGGVPVLHWRVEKGALPAGIKLEDDGLLHGATERAGEYRFTVSVTDSGKPQQAVQKEFVLRVVQAMALKWKVPAYVAGSRIQGSAEISNTTPDDLVLTFYVLAVAGNGRATAIGYQHFLLHRGTTDMTLPFGETLPRGAYVVHVDAVGEVEKKNLIYRERMETPAPLQVAIGP